MFDNSTVLLYGAVYYAVQVSFISLSVDITLFYEHFWAVYSCGVAIPHQEKGITLSLCMLPMLVTIQIECVTVFNFSFLKKLNMQVFK